jgi:hypothetical protein
MDRYESRKSRSRLSEILQAEIDANPERINPASIADWCAKNSRTVYLWLADEGGPDQTDCKLLIQRLPKTSRMRFAQAVVDELLRSSGLSATIQPRQSRSELDINHDGKIDCDDALDWLIKDSRSRQEALERIRQHSQCNSLSEMDRQRVLLMLNEDARCISETKEILQHYESQSMRVAK